MAIFLTYEARHRVWGNADWVVGVVMRNLERVEKFFFVFRFDEHLTTKTKDVGKIRLRMYCLDKRY